MSGMFSSLRSTLPESDIKLPEAKSITAENIKQSKNLTNALRNSLPFYTQSKSENVESSEDDTSEKSSAWRNGSKTSRRKSVDDEDEKDVCEKSDSESIGEVKTSFVLSRIANYESPIEQKGCLSHGITRQKCNDIEYIKTSICKGRTGDGSYSLAGDTRSTSPVNELQNPSSSQVSSTKDIRDNSSSPKGRRAPLGHYKHSKETPSLRHALRRTNSKTKDDKDNLINRIRSEIEDIESKREDNYNIIFGNKDVLKLLSNKHLANLNIKVERNPESKKEKHTDNKWRESLGTYIVSKQGVRTSFRSSRRRKRPYQHRQNHLEREEKGVSDSTSKESCIAYLNDGMNPSHFCSKRPSSPSKDSPNVTSEYNRKRFPEYTKVIKKTITTSVDQEVPPRSLSTSPIERAPVVKKICSSGTRLKRDSEPSLTVNPVKKVDSFRGSRIKRKGSITHFPRNKISVEQSEEESFVNAQAVRLRRKNSKAARRSEYRVSVTIQPSTVANLADKFNAIILQNKNKEGVTPSDTSFGTTFQSLAGPRSYSSPRASFKRKYRHKAARAAKGSKGELSSKKSIPEIVTLSSAKTSLNNSLSELNMKDLFEDCDYNKTDEEKVCEKIKTALSGGKFKGETDDSEDDLTAKNREICSSDISSNFDSIPQDKKIDSNAECMTEEENVVIINEEDVSETPSKIKENSEVNDLHELIKGDNEEHDKENLAEGHNEDYEDNNDKGLPNVEGEERCEIPSNKNIIDEQTKAEERLLEDNASEISSIYTEAKSKKKNDSNPYATLKAAVKNTVKRTKEKDSMKKDGERGRKHRSPSQERGKWYKRSRSKERQPEKEVKEKKGNKKEGKLYERWTFKRLRNKSQEREKSMSERELNVQDDHLTEPTEKGDSDTYQDVNPKNNALQGSYSKVKLSSRSRNREKKSIKKKENATKTDSSYEENLLCDLAPEDSEVKENLPSEAMSSDLSSQNVADDIYGPVEITPPKSMPPPPKTPIPSPPLSLKKILKLSKTKNPKKIRDNSESQQSEDKKEPPDNLYENIYSPELRKTRSKLEQKGIKPNSSFLWSETAQSSPRSPASEVLKILPLEDMNNSRDFDFTGKSNLMYDRIENNVISLPDSGKSCSDGHNYTEIQNNSDMNSQTGYDEIWSSSPVRYDEIGSPPSCKYDDIAMPPTTSYGTLDPTSEGYDPVIPQKLDDDCNTGVVTAQLAVVKEYLSDSVSYLYDDIAMYNNSQSSNSYEPVCPPHDLDTTTPTVRHVTPLIPERTTSHPNCLKPKISPTLKGDHMIIKDDGVSDSSDEGAHEVLSYKLTRIGAPEVNNNSAQKLPKSTSSLKIDSTGKGNYPSILITTEPLVRKKKKKTPKKKQNKKVQREFCHQSVDEVDEWTDLEEEEEDYNKPVIVMTQNAKSKTQFRDKRLRGAYRKSWTDGVRIVAANNNRLHKGSFHPSNAVKSTQLYGYTPKVCQSNRGLSDQIITCTLKPKRAETDNEDEATGHYEAIYEVISPADEAMVATNDVPEDEMQDEDYSQQDDIDENDSFDSDDSDDAYSRLHPQNSDTSLQDSTLRTDSFSSDISMENSRSGKDYSCRSQSYQPHSINKIAEAANLGMKRLRRNWSQTKNEVKTGLIRIKKKGTFSMPDMKGAESRSEFFLYDAPSPQNDKQKWSLKNKFRKKSISSSTSSQDLFKECSTGNPSKNYKDQPTFHLTLTIASDGQEDTETKGTLCTPCGTGSHVADAKSPHPSGSSHSSSSYSSVGPPLLRSTSSKSCPGILRPKTAPPAPPQDKGDCEEDETRDITKEQLAIKLNQLLLSGPIAPPGRRILRSSDNSSSDTSPVPVILPSDKKPSRPLTHSTSLKIFSSNPASLSLPPEISNSVPLNLPQNRNSIVSSASHGSSEGYIVPSDIASQPPPLPARPLSCSSSFVSKRHSQPLALPNSSLVRDPDAKMYIDFNAEGKEEEEPSYISSHFADEPLYQFYTAKVEKAALLQGDYSSEDDYEVINEGTNQTDLKQARPTAMELVAPTDGRRTFWCELPEVVSSGILNKISNQERKLQEAMFEVITSEASYLRSLGVLVSNFMNCPSFNGEDDSVITSREKKVLFSDILPVKKSSELFLNDLEKRWQESFEITSITDIILRHSTSFLTVYVKYCSNQIYQERMLRQLKENNPRFLEVLNRLESSPMCQSLAMHSFLMLPMQRITRLPLLLDAIFNRLEYGSSQWQECKLALGGITKIVAECNEEARKMERMEEMHLVSRQLEFKEVKAIPLTSASRWLVKKGELTRLTWRENDAKLTFGRKISKHSLFFFLFSDLLIVTKKKSEDVYTVLDYCPRNMVQVLELESAEKFPGRLLDGHKNLIIMTMLQNHDKRTVEMVLSCPRESDRSRWMQAVTPRTSENPDERIYEEWDCPQVQVIHSYAAAQPDELSLEVADVINVLKKTSDGWFQGERLRDGERGWFPGNHTLEIGLAHVRARNLRQRYRLLAISGSFVDELKREKERIEKEEKKKDRRRTITIKEVL